MENTKKILLFQIKQEKRKQIEQLCRELCIETVTIACKQYLEPLGFLAKIQAIKSSGKIYQGSALSKEMMVFSGINQTLLESFLQKYKALSIEPIDLKAILTPTNVFWNPIQLYQELIKEHNSLRHL